jgi:NADH-quinone oxidoreductase subunit H
VTLTPEFWTYVKVVLLVASVPAIIGFVVVLAERRIMAFMQVRLGPNRVGPEGTLQGLADLLKLIAKESRRQKPRKPCTFWRPCSP